MSKRGLPITSVILLIFQRKQNRIFLASKMDIEIENLDSAGSTHHQTEFLSELALLKHLAMAGQGFMPSIRHYTKAIGIFLHYIEYLNPAALRNSRFSEPPPMRQDPTEKGQFSNLVGKGVADFLSRRLSHAKVTFSYEAVMAVNGNKIKGRRPDLYCIGQGFQFAVEAKGLAKAEVSSAEMAKHKKQSRQGPVPVNFSIASISFNLFHSARCKYHDPINKNTSYNQRANDALLYFYYRGIFEYLDDKFFRVEIGEIEGMRCFFIDIIGPGTPYSILLDGRLSLCLVLQEDFKAYTIDSNIKKHFFNERQITGPNYYLDTDGIGFALREFHSSQY